MICYGAYTVNLGGSQVFATIVEDALSNSTSIAAWASALSPASVLGGPQSIVTFASGPFRGLKLSDSMFETKVCNSCSRLSRGLS